MLIHSKNHVTNLDAACIQPNAVDIRATQLWLLEENQYGQPLRISEQGPKQFINRTEILPDLIDGVNYWLIPPLSVVTYLTGHETTVPDGYAGFIQIRSTLARNGLISTNGIFDSGYSGEIGGTFHNNTNNGILLEVGCRVAQYYMIRAETDSLYDGYYNVNKSAASA